MDVETVFPAVVLFVDELTAKEELAFVELVGTVVLELELMVDEVAGVDEEDVDEGAG